MSAAFIACNCSYGTIFNRRRRRSAKILNCKANSPCNCAVCAGIIAFSLPVVLLIFLGQNLGYSQFYRVRNTRIDEIEHTNNLRIAEALTTFNQSIFQKRVKQSLAATEAKYSFVVMTAPRDKSPHYLLQSMHHLLRELLHVHHKTNFSVQIFNGDISGATKLDIEILSAFLKLRNRPAWKGPFPKANSNEAYEKEKQDYVSALRLANEIRAQYIILLEDDALANGNLIPKLEWILHHRLPYALHKSNMDWAYLKLYFPEKWAGYGNREIPELILTGLIFAGLCWSFVYCNRRSTHVFVLSILIGAYCAFICYLFGRQHLMELRKPIKYLHTISQDLGCCTVAVLFQQKHLEEIAQRLAAMPCNATFPKDLALDLIADHLKLAKFLVSPNLFTHVGFRSSIKSATKEEKEFFLLFDS